MTLIERLSQLAGRIGQEIKAVKTLFEGKIGNTTALPTTSKELVGSITEVYSLATGQVNSSRLVGLIDPANVPVQQFFKTRKTTAISIAALSVGDQAALTTNGANGTCNVVILANGEVYIYDGGTKTDVASYTPVADHTPEWSLIASKPTEFASTIVLVAGLSAALSGLQSSTAIGNTDTILVDVFNAALV